jgi:hypothetical protein
MIGRRKWLLSGLVGAALCAGCDPATTLFFLMPEPKEEPELKALVSAGKKKEVKVAILTYATGLPLDFVGADREVAELLSKQLNELFRANQDKVVLVPWRKVQEYKNQHPSRHGWDPAEVGRNFNADYVLYLELKELSLYEPGSANQMLRGRAEMSATVVDVEHPDDSEGPEPIHYVYPAESRGAVAVDLDTTPRQFRKKFLVYVARRLSWCFAPHAKHDREVEVEGNF